MKLGIFCFALAFLVAPAMAQSPQEMAGDEFRIIVSYDKESTGQSGTSCSRGNSAFVEKIMAVRDGGFEKLYDIPREPGKSENLIDWQFPVHVFEGDDGQLQLLNRSELEQRRDAWLKSAKIPTEACGSWYFTWNAFQIECDPDAVLEKIAAIRIQPRILADGAVFAHPAAVNPGRLAHAHDGARAFTAEMTVNPDYFYRQEAQSDVIVGEITTQPITFEEAYSKRSAAKISGTIGVVVEADETGRAAKQTTTIKTSKIDVDGKTDTGVSTQTIERKKF